MQTSRLKGTVTTVTLMLATGALASEPIPTPHLAKNLSEPSGVSTCLSRLLEKSSGGRLARVRHISGPEYRVFFGQEIKQQLMLTFRGYAGGKFRNVWLILSSGDGAETWQKDPSTEAMSASSLNPTGQAIYYEFNEESRSPAVDFKVDLGVCAGLLS